MGVAAAVTVAVAVLVAPSRCCRRSSASRASGCSGDASCAAPGQPRGRAPDRVAPLADVHLAPAGARARGSGRRCCVVIALPALDLRLGLPDDSVAGPSTTQRKAYDLLAAGFGPGFNGPLTVVLDATGVADATTAAQTVASDITALDDVRVRRARRSSTRPATPRSSTSSPRARRAAPRRSRLVADIRAAAPAIEAATGIDVGVTGQTAIIIDISQQARRRAAALPAGGGRARVPAADARVPVAARAADGDPRLPAERRSPPSARSSRSSSGAGSATCSGSSRPSADREPAAGLHDRRRVRARHGLPGLPGHPHARGARPRRWRPSGRSSWASATGARWSRPPRSS